MIDFDAPWQTFATFDPAMSESDRRRELDAMQARQRRIDGVFAELRLGRLPAGEIEAMLDALAEDEVGPSDFLDSVTCNIAFILENQIPVETYGMAFTGDSQLIL